MMRFLRKYIFANAGSKVLALGISFLLWATYTSEPFAVVGFQVPLEFTTMPAHLEISGDVPTTVRVRVRGRSVLLRRLVPADLSVHVDLQDWKEGASQVRASPATVRAPFGPTLVRGSPSAFPVALLPPHSPTP